MTKLLVTPTANFHIWRKGRDYQVDDTPDIRAAIAKGRLVVVDDFSDVLPAIDDNSYPPDATPLPDPVLATETVVDVRQLKRMTRPALIELAEQSNVLIDPEWTKDAIIAALGNPT